MVVAARTKMRRPNPVTKSTPFQDWASKTKKRPKKLWSNVFSFDKQNLHFRRKLAIFNSNSRILDGRDPDYQKLAIKGLIGSSKRVLGGTKNDDKIKAINEGVKVLEDFLEKFDNENRSKLNLAYLPSSIIKAFPSPKSSLVAEFLDVYHSKANGNYKHLRTLYPKDDDTTSWDIIRNKKLDKLKKKLGDSKLFHSDGKPTSDHLELIYWAYSPQADKVKAAAAGKDNRKRKSHADSSSSSDEEVKSSSAKKQKA